MMQPTAEHFEREMGSYLYLACMCLFLMACFGVCAYTVFKPHPDQRTIFLFMCCFGSANMFSSLAFGYWISYLEERDKWRVAVCEQVHET